MDQAVASARIRRFQRTALVLLVASGVVNIVDRSTLAIGLPLIRKDLGLSLAQSGYLLSAFLWAYALAQLPAGAWVDRLGARFMLSTGLGLWSMAQMLGGLVTTLPQFVVVRALLGAGESPQFPTCARIVADWFHRRERGMATGIWNCSSSLGTAIAAPLLTFLMLRLGWRWMFVLMGLAGIVLAWIVRRVHRDPNQVELTAEEKRYLESERAVSKRVSWRIWGELFRFRTTWGMIAGFFGALYVSWIYYAWLPQYLEIEWHLSVAKTGWVASIPYLFGVAGSLFGGRLCDVLLRRGFSPIASRKIPVVVALAGTALLTFLASRTHTSALAVTFISASLFLLTTTTSSSWAMASVAAPLNYTASIGAIQNFGGYLGGALAPIVTGLVVQKTASFQPALLVGACVALLASIAHLVLVKAPIEV